MSETAGGPPHRFQNSIRADRLARSTRPFHWGRRGGRTWSGMASASQARSKSAMNSPPPSTWYGGDGERHGPDHLEREAPGVAGGGPRVNPGGHEPGDRADGAELPGGPVVAAEGHVVDLDHLAGGPGPVAVSPAPRPGAAEGPAAPGLDPALAEGGRPDAPVRDRPPDDAPDGGHGQADASAVEHGLEPELAHERILGPQPEHGPVVGVRPAPAANGARAGAPGLERGRAAAPEGPSPVVVGAFGQSDGARGVAAAHAAADHLVDEFEGAQALFGDSGGVGVDPRALAGRGAGVQQFHARVPCSLVEPSMPDPAARVSVPPGLEPRSPRSLRSSPGATLPIRSVHGAKPRGGSSEMFLSPHMRYSESGWLSGWAT